jgi:excisionase family DNA binding protein
MKPDSAVKFSIPQPPLGSYNARQVAEVLNVHPETIRDALRANRITGFRMGNRWRVTHAVLIRLMETGVSPHIECGAP